MNYLVFLDAGAGELEKILSGTKSMLVKEFDPAQMTHQPIIPGDNLYFLRNKEDHALQVKATVVRVRSFTNQINHDLANLLKEMQPKLQLIEDQYNCWSAKQQILLVEFKSAHKINLIQVASNKIADRSDWIAFKEFGSIME